MQRISYFGNSWVGMFFKTTDSLTFVPKDLSEKNEEKIKEELKTQIKRVSVCETNLLGLYLSLNSNGVILPNVSLDREVLEFKSFGLNVYLSSEKHNAHGNNIAVNDFGGIINPHVDPIERKKLEDVLGVELVPMPLANHTTVGSACLVTNTGFLAHYKSTEEEIAQLKSIFKVSGSKGSVNMGAGFVPYGVVVNKNGYLAGESTSAFELGRVEEALDLIR